LSKILNNSTKTTPIFLLKNNVMSFLLKIRKKGEKNVIKEEQKMAGVKLLLTSIVGIFLGFGWNSMEIVGLSFLGLIGGIALIVINSSSSSGTTTITQNTCKSCNKTIPTDATYCPYCSTQTSNNNDYSCQHCGKEVKSDYKQCPNCGEKLNLSI
jgi:RNA polymerase subunit RPABC4/transcription elongation factor Spt4